MTTEMPARPRSTLLAVLLMWLAFYASFTLFMPALLDDADSVHAEVAREMLLRHDYVTLYANGIRYLEKAPLLYWSMAACMKVFGLFGVTSPHTLAAAARLPLAFSVFALALVCEAFARRLFRTVHAGLYAAMIVLTSFGIFIFTRITIPDAMVCLWLMVALYAFWRTEEEEGTTKPLYLLLFAAACAMNVLTKGLIGVVFPVIIVGLYLLLTRGIRGTFVRFRELRPVASLLVFFVLAAPWHILAGLANPMQGHPTPFHFVNGRWQVPLPRDGNVRGWFWFYFMNEHILRYLNLRVPRDYDTDPLWLFWGLCIAWLLPWSAFAFHAVWDAVSECRIALSVRREAKRSLERVPDDGLKSGLLLHLIAGAFVLLFFSLSTRQEYYVLPALPSFAILIGGWLARTTGLEWPHTAIAREVLRINQRITVGLLVFGILFASIAIWFLIHVKTPAPNTDLSTLLQQNPGDYALSMGHFLDLNAQSLGLFRPPLIMSALSLLLGPLVSLYFRKRAELHAANIALFVGTAGFLFASHLALQTFAPVLSSAQLADAIAPQVQPQDLLAIHGEYEAGSTLGFYLKRSDIHILEGRSSNLWYGSFFPDAPPLFETPQSIAQKWSGVQRIFLWQSLTDEPRYLPPVAGPVYVIAKSGGKEIVSNQPNR